MKRQIQLLIILILSMGVNFNVLSNTIEMLPTQIQKSKLPSLAPMLEKVLPAVISVHIRGTDNLQIQDIPEPLKRFFGQALGDNPPQPFEGIGSGVIIDSQKGYVLTNNHVINGADNISVQLGDGSKHYAKLIGHDEQTDIALIQIKGATNLTQIKVADSDQLKVGDFAIAIGNPFGLGQTATSGIISALGRYGLNLEGLENFIQTDAAINRGNSGGALVNLNGELIGINTAILSSAGGNIGIGFAIPSNMAMNLAKQLIKFGKVQRGQLGIKGTEMSADIAQAFHVNIKRGAFVSEVVPKSAAEKYGIRSGDIITSFNNKTINSFAELRVKIATTPPGQQITLGLIRDGKYLTIDIILDQNISNMLDQAQLLSPMLQGAILMDGTTKKGKKGIKVYDVKKNTLAEQVGLQKHDVIVGINRNRVKNLKEMRKILQDKLPPMLALNVVRDDENIYLLLRR